ncbi:MAG: hypothetical protein ACP5D2_04670 [Candidatus Nanoarchaeia archaeon]
MKLLEIVSNNIPNLKTACQKGKGRRETTTIYQEIEFYKQLSQQQNEYPIPKRKIRTFKTIKQPYK